MNPYPQLEAASLPLIRNYHADLTTHDRRALEANPDIPFLHWTYASGTAMIQLFPADSLSWPAQYERVPYLFGQADREHILSQVQVIADYWRDHGSLLVQYFNGRTLNATEPAIACRLAARYISNLTDEWRRHPNPGRRLARIPNHYLDPNPQLQTV